MYDKIVKKHLGSIVNKIRNMNNHTKTSKGIIPLAFIIVSMLISYSTNAQKSPLGLKIGYEQVYVRSGTTGGLAENNWIWNDPNRGDFLAFRTSRTHAFNIGLRYDVFKWWTITTDFKQYYRRYYVWSGTYTNPVHFEYFEQDPNQFVIIPYGGIFGLPDMFLGRTLRAISWQVGTEFSHSISRNKKWKIHYFASLNRDQYEVDLDAFDNNIIYGVDRAFYNNTFTKKRVDYQIDGGFKLKSFNPNRSGYQGSTNIGIALSRKLKNGVALRFEFGFRNLLWTKNLQLYENHWELDLTYTEYEEGTDNVVYQNSTVKEFPLEIGGFYNNISITFRPFRSKRDNPDYVRKKINLMPKFLRRK